MRRRIENILLGFTIDNKPFTVKDLGVAGAITVLLKDALSPNLVQTTEHTPAFVHGGPFANIAHGCNSVLATKLAMTFGDYVVTEARFGADLGCREFYNIKCRKSWTSAEIDHHRGYSSGIEDARRGRCRQNQGTEHGRFEGRCEEPRQAHRKPQSFGQTVVVAFNRYANDTDEELDFVRQHCVEEMGVGCHQQRVYGRRRRCHRTS